MVVYLFTIKSVGVSQALSDPRTIRQNLKDSVLLEGKHYIRPFGGRKILYIWEVIEKDMLAMASDSLAIPMANGGICHG